MSAFSSIKKAAIKPKTKTHENIKILFPYPPKTWTNQPTKKTADAVNNLPALKQKPVAVARICFGNILEIKSDRTPWLIPKKKPRTPILK